MSAVRLIRYQLSLNTHVNALCYIVMTNSCCHLVSEYEAISRINDHNMKEFISK